ncbi:WAP four-disulfide core domain protein 3 isoform X1 [Pseudochaenichthys georgianus]|uniref:WAP four-disulfide core domain protein 3 isoform X1 n=1 Tax=Pseudochaenichthys georgianus TaxID=52239 RepID=UPI00146CC80B|nr:perlwapin isoform X1 [Pseudochaenichthys georgianus]
MTTKPGVCPRRNSPGLCAEFCSNDNDCFNDEKCCHNGCGHQCIAHTEVSLTNWRCRQDTNISSETAILPKPGHCPRLLNVIPSHKGCECDEDCPADNKCCVFDCGAVCVPPAFTKPGVCPRRNWGSGMCAEYCSNDNDCPNDEKCCHNGCGHECIAPYTVKRGRCALPQGTSMCAEYCYHDGQCPGEQKCCKTTCGHACSEPC